MSFPEYQHYRRSGATWISNLPTNWRIAALKWVARRYAGGTPDKTKADYWTDGTIPWLNSGAVNQRLITEASEYITEEAYSHSSARWVPEGALVMALAGQGKTKGMVAQLAFSATCNQSMAAIVPLGDINSRYLFWWLDAQYQNIRNLAGGDLRDGLNLELLGQIPCPIPTFDEQLSIASFLDRETTKIDALVTEQKRLIELLEEKRQAVIAHAVTKGLDPTVPMKAAGFDWLEQVPSHWRVMRFQRCVFVAEGQVDPKTATFSAMKLIAPDFIESGTGRLLPLETAEDQGAISGKYLCRRGEVVYSKIRPALRKVCVAPEDCLCSADMYPLRAHNGLENEFLFWLILSEHFSAFAVLESERVAMPKINRESLKKVVIAFPPVPEQIEIVAHIKAEISRVDGLIFEAKDAIGLLQERRSALISAAVTGQIDVRHLETA